MTSQVHTNTALEDAKTLAKGGSLSLFGSVGGAVLAMALVFVVTWGLGADDGGAFFEAIALFNIAVVAVAIGADTGLVRFTAGALAVGDSTTQTRLLQVALFPVLATGAVVAVIGSLMAPALGRGLGGADHAAEVELMIRVLAAFLPIGALNLAVLGATRGYGTMVPTVVAERIGRPLLQLGLAGAAIAAGVTAGWLAAAWAAAFAISYLAAVIWLARLRSSHGHDTGEVHRELGEVAREFWAFSLPRALASLFRVGVLWLDVLLVGALMSPRDAAIYTVATRVIQAGFLALDALGQAIEPMFSSLLASGRVDRTKGLYQVSTAWLVGLTWPLFLGAWIFAPTVLRLFGSDFAEASSVVAILAGSALLATGFGSIDVLLVMAGKSVWSLWNSAASLTTNLVLNLILIPEMGLNGAALAWAISRVVSNLLPYLQLRSLLAINPVGRGWLAAAAASLGTFGLIGLVMRMSFGSSFLVVALYAIVAGSAYAALVWAWRKHLDLTAFAGLLGRRFRPAGESR